jgi:hypothetical protein
VESKTRLQRGLKQQSQDNILIKIAEGLAVEWTSRETVESKTRLQRGLKLNQDSEGHPHEVEWNQRPDFKGD